MMKTMTTTLATHLDPGPPTTQELGTFLIEYGSWLLGAGATCIRIEKNVRRIAAAYGRHVEITVMPRHLYLAIADDSSGGARTLMRSIASTPVSFNINSRLSELSWGIADGKITFAEAQTSFREIISSDSERPLLVLLLVTLANASFCRLFGGDLTAMCVVALATAAGYWLKQALLRRKTDLRVVVMLCSFVSAVLGSTDILFGVGSTPSVALATSVLYLVPGIPFLNSFSDLLDRHYICAFSRLTDAAVLTACLSIGLFAAMALESV